MSAPTLTRPAGDYDPVLGWPYPPVVPVDHRPDPLPRDCVLEAPPPGTPQEPLLRRRRHNDDRQPVLVEAWVTQRTGPAR